jgi:recombinational DNA repair protein RecT
MSISFHKFIFELKIKYESSQFSLSQKTNAQLSFAESVIRDTSRTIPLRMAGTESISEAVMLAGKLGIDLDPTLGHARLMAIQTNSLNKTAYDSRQLRLQGDVMNASVSVKSNTNTAKTLIGAFCVIELASGDRLPTAISKAEIHQLAELSNLLPDALPDDFALKHVFKRALKTLVTPSNSQLSALQQATKLIDINLFEKN